MNMSPETDEKMKQLSIQALRDTNRGFDEFYQKIDACCVAFEDGDDDQGRTALGELVAPLGEFVGFCHSVLTNCHQWLPEEMVQRFNANNKRLEEALHSIVGEAEDDNLIGVADACRVELTEALKEYQTLFPRIAAELEQ